MKELSLNILDIAENSAKAGAKNIRIELTETDTLLIITVSDDGCGMKPDLLQSVVDPFTTTRTTRKVGLGIPLFKLAAEQTGGTLTIVSRHVSVFPAEHGTVVTARFYKNHIDCAPLGDTVSTMLTLVQGHPDIDFLFVHTVPGRTVRLDTKEMRKVLLNVPLNSYEVLQWISEYLRGQYAENSEAGGTCDTES